MDFLLDLCYFFAFLRRDLFVNKTERVSEAAIELTFDWPLRDLWSNECITLWKRVLWIKFDGQRKSLANWLLVDLCVTFDPPNVIHFGQGHFWPNLVVIEHKTNWPLVHPCVAFDPVNVLHSGQGFLWLNLTDIPTLVELNYSICAYQSAHLHIHRQIDPWLTLAWPSTPQMYQTLVKGSLTKFDLLRLLNYCMFAFLVHSFLSLVACT